MYYVMLLHLIFVFQKLFIIKKELKGGGKQFQLNSEKILKSDTMPRRGFFFDNSELNWFLGSF